MPNQIHGTECPRSLSTFLKVLFNNNFLYKMGQYFLDIQYLLPMSPLNDLQCRFCYCYHSGSKYKSIKNMPLFSLLYSTFRKCGSDRVRNT